MNRNQSRTMLRPLQGSPCLASPLSMDAQTSLPTTVLAKRTLKLSLIPSKIFGLSLIFFALCSSTAALILLEIPSTTSDESLNYLLLFMTCLTFFLSMTLLPLLLTTNSTKPHDTFVARSIHHLALAILIASFTTLLVTVAELCMALTDNELSQGGFCWVIQSELIFFATAVLHKLISGKFTSCHHKILSATCFALCIAFAGLYIGPLSYLPGTNPYSSIIYRADRLNHFALIPVTFVLGTILLILGVLPDSGSQHPVISVVSKESLTVLTLAVGLTTLLTGTLSMISVPLVDLAMSGGLGVGGVGER